MQQETFHWPHKDLLDVDQLTQEELFHLLDTAANLHEINSRPVKKVPILKGKSVVLFFAEPSTRTKTSFDMAGKRLSADTFGLAKSGSSLQKGESIKDTALTLQAMNPDVIVIRHSSSGAAQFLAERLHCGVVNAGDGWHAHPTQALLDAFSLRQVWGHDRNAFKGKNLLILGDCAHSRVCRSNVLLLTKLGVNVSLCAPRTLLPAGVDNWPVTVYTDSKKAVRDMDAVMCLRLQLERQQAGLLPDLREYSKRFCLTTASTPWGVCVSAITFMTTSLTVSGRNRPIHFLLSASPAKFSVTYRASTSSGFSSLHILRPSTTYMPSSRRAFALLLRLTTRFTCLFDVLLIIRIHSPDTAYLMPSSSSSHTLPDASLGILKSPLGETATEPTLGPSGRQERLNCWEKKRR